MSRGRQGHICGQLLLQKLNYASLQLRDFFHDRFDSVPSASNHSVARGRQGHICGKFLV